MTNKSQANTNRDFIWITSGSPAGIWPKLRWWAASQGQTSPSAWQFWLLKLSITVLSLLSFLFPCSRPPLLWSFCLFQVSSPLLFSPFLWQEILTIAGQSFPPSQETVGSGLAESECSAPVGVCQQLANKGCCSPPQRLCYIHGKLEVKSLNTVIMGSKVFEVGRLWRILN